MRLLQRNKDDDFTLTEDIIDDIPPYAVLSHTWGADTEEVTFKNLKDGTGKDKTGYTKIRFCEEQARRDSLQHFWVDTCCIDKSNNTELAEAINSMFHWYHNAVKCYVYLSDVQRDALDPGEASYQPWESAFRESRWFTRGWTLQELIAPKSVEFFSKDWEQLGNRKNLGTIIYEITGVPNKALQGVPLSNFSVAERMSWAERRETTRKEDLAYSLLGIFDVYMPLIYGEGKENAFKRLRELIDAHLKKLDSDLLHRLPYAAEAQFNSYAKQDSSSSCLPNTRVSLLKEIDKWVDSEDERCIFWLSGLAGTGKSTVARTIARRYFERKRLGASFFFSKGGGDVGHAGRFFTTLAVQLARNVPQILPLVLKAIKKQEDVVNQSLRDQWRQLVLGPLSRLDMRFSPFSYLLIVDALDECDNEGHIQTILQLLAEARSLTTVRLRIFVTSRPEIPIRQGIYSIPQAEHQDFVLHKIHPTIVKHDISLFLEHNLRIIGQKWTFEVDWPGEQVLRQLVHKSSGLFIWAATACRFLDEGEVFAEDRLCEVLKGTSSNGTPEQHLDQIYLTVLHSSVPRTFREPEKVRLYSRLRLILGSIVTLLSPLPPASLGRLTGLTKIQVKQTLGKLHAILDVPNNTTGFLHLHHPSFRDFLLHKDRCEDPNLWIDEKQAHQKLATGCIRLMSEKLKKDICEMQAPGCLITHVESSRVVKCLPPEVQYASLYWVQHLQRSNAQLYDNGEVHRFLRVHLLHWLEALGWMGKINEGILAILSLKVFISADQSPNLHAFIKDAERFATYNKFIIEQAPLQLYCSALVFAPEMSIIRKEFEEDVPYWIRRQSRVPADWDSALQTLEGHSKSVNSGAFSPDGKQVVSGSADETIRLWDAGTGALLRTLEGHSKSVNSVAFSPDGKQVVSGSADETIRLWDIGTGALLRALEGHWDWVNSVVFSPDGKQVVSGSADETIRLWDIGTGAPLQTLEGHSHWVNSVAFSPDGKQVVSGSIDKTVRLWDAITGAPLRTLEGHSHWVNSVVFSPDGKQVISGSIDKTVRLWDAGTGAPLQALEGYSDSVRSVAISPHGKLLPTLRVRDNWLVDGYTNILRLPTDYYSTCEAVWNKIILFGHLSGRISLIQTKEGPKLIM